MKRGMFGLVIFVLMIVAAVYLSDMVRERKEEKIKGDIKRVYELANPGSSVTDVAVIREGDIYRVVFKLNGDFKEVYMDQDGRYVFPRRANVETAISSFEFQKEFFSCLFDKGVVLYGQIGTNGTDLQLRNLGSSPYAGYVYYDCSGDRVAACLGRNVTSVPTWVINGSRYVGVLDLDEIERLTGCTYKG